jgi:rod shape determining protein RodA
MREKSSILQNTDWLLLALYLVLVLLGWGNIYAATYNEDHQSIFDLSQSYGKQMLWIITAFVLAGIIFLLDTQFFKTSSFVIYGLFLLMLLAVLVIGSEIKGSKSWIVIGSFSLQPAEFAKYGTALALSNFFSNTNKRFENTKVLFYSALILILPAALIMLQPDTGSTLVYAAFILVFFREGLSPIILVLGAAAIVLFITTMLTKDLSVDFPFDVSIAGNWIVIIGMAVFSFLLYYLNKRQKNLWKYLIIMYVLAVGYIVSVEFVFDNVLGSHQRDRINELLGITSDPKGAGYNVHQSKIAIGSGGLLGKGFLQGTQTKYDFVPEQSTDFIFCTVGEEWGFVGSFLVIVLFLVLLVRIIFIAERQRSNFARIYGYCVGSIFFFHFTINIGMTIGLVPVIGIPLPFFSYGGSSLWSFTVLLFTFIKMDSDRKHVLR